VPNLQHLVFDVDASAIQTRHNKHENNEINRLDKLGNTSHRRRAADIVGGY